MRLRTKIMTFSGVGIVGAFIIIGLAEGGQPNTTPIVVSTSTPLPTITAVPVVAPSPDGTYQGACDYSLGDNPTTGTAVATGDVELNNTGNVGTVNKVTITWPQQGYAPLSMTTTVKVPAGGANDVPFHKTLSSVQLDNLQNWQMGHLGNTGCTYTVTITDTYGNVVS